MTDGALPRVVLVTGAGSASGIGFAVARRLAREGATVVLAATADHVYARAAELTAEGMDALGVVGDLTRPADAQALVDAALARHGRLDVLVNNAGMASVAAGSDDDLPVELLAPEQFTATLDRNLGTAFLVTRAALPALVASGGGRVVTVSSTTGPLLGMPGQAGYGAAKAALVGLTRALALEVGRRGVTVNAVLPGWIDTSSATDAERGAAAATPVGRPGTPEEVAAAVAFLASADASYVTGTTLVVDGGNSVVEDRSGALRL